MIVMIEILVPINPYQVARKLKKNTFGVISIFFMIEVKTNLPGEKNKLKKKRVGSCSWFL